MRFVSKERLEAVLGFDNIPKQSVRLFSLYVLYGDSSVEFEKVQEKKRIHDNSQRYFELCRAGAMCYPTRYSKYARM